MTMQDEKPIETDRALVEIYKQKYDTFRHFDRIRWQVIQIAIFVSAGIIVLEGDNPDSYWPSVLSRAMSGAILIFFAVMMFELIRVTMANNVALQKIAEVIGDQSIPSSTASWRRITLAIALFFLVAGSSSIISVFFV